MTSRRPCMTRVEADCKNDCEWSFEKKDVMQDLVHLFGKDLSLRNLLV